MMLAFDLPLFPEQASEQAWQVDAITLALTALCTVMTVGLFVVITYFLIRYRHTSNVDRRITMRGQSFVEITWSAIPMLLFIGLFAWGGAVFLKASKAPADATDIYVVGFQWYWDILHENGRREIGELHVPVGRAIRLMMTSADVIHDFAVPAFRIKRDVLPGKYTSEWFRATKPGHYYLFCDQYCGTKHGEMVGTVYAMRPEDYEAWLRGGNAPQATLASTGARLFRQYGCSGCHRPDASVAAPDLRGLYGRPVPLEGGGTVIADEGYLRDSILNPAAQVVAGFKPIMPSYRGQISEPDLLAIIAFLKHGAETPPPAGAEVSPAMPIPPSP